MTAAKTKKPVRIPDYTVAEEIGNAVSHGLGALFGLSAMILMGIRADSVLSFVCGMVYGLSMVLLYATSCVYHAVPASDPLKGSLRIADHCMVFLLVLGSCVPVFLRGIGGTAGWCLFSFVLGSSLLGIVLTLWDMDRTEKVCAALHLLNGWSVAVGFHWLVSSIGWQGTGWLLAGGIVYSAGVVFFALGASKRFMHGVFHLFCLAGTVLQFVGICFYVL